MKFRREIQDTKDIKLYSFDIFDTLVTRRVATPQGIFAIMQEKIKNADLPQFLKDNFYEIRIGSERLARKREYRLNKTREIFLEDIYRIIQINSNLSDEQITYLLNLELETEKENLVLLPSFEKLKNLISAGKRVICISDMYLNLPQLHYILDDLNPVFKNLPIYASCEYNASKNDGLLYEKVKETENVEYCEWLHHGDNQFSDIKVAKAYGIKTKYISKIELESYQKYLLEKLPCNANLQRLMGAGRLCKLNLPTQNSDKFIFGACFTGPIMYDYVSWVLDIAIERGFKTLYFIARDGYIPKLVADIIIKKKNLNIKTKYIYGSRKVWRIPFENEYEYFVKLFFEEYIDMLSPNLLCYRMGIPFEDFKNITGIKNLNKKLSKAEIKKLKTLFVEHPGVKNYILENNKKRENLLISYFSQEIDFSEKNIAFVDVQGSGQTCDNVANILNKISNCTIHSFYIQNTLMNQKENSKKYCYVPTSSYLVFLELLCRSNEGQTIRYKIKNGKTIPVKEDISDKISNWGFEEYINGISAFTQNISFIGCLPNAQSINMINYYTKYLNKEIDLNTAKILGSMHYKGVGKETHLNTAAPKLHFFDLLKDFCFCTNKEKPLFPEISYALSSKPSRIMQDFMKKVPTLRHLIFDIKYNENNKKQQIRILGIKFTTHKIIKEEISDNE